MQVLGLRLSLQNELHALLLQIGLQTPSLQMGLGDARMMQQKRSLLRHHQAVSA
jgi:hypothetical protein